MEKKNWSMDKLSTQYSLALGSWQDVLDCPLCGQQYSFLSTSAYSVCQYLKVIGRPCCQVKGSFTENQGETSWESQTLRYVVFFGAFDKMINM